MLFFLSKLCSIHTLLFFKYFIHNYQKPENSNLSNPCVLFSWKSKLAFISFFDVSNYTVCSYFIIGKRKFKHWCTIFYSYFLSMVFGLNNEILYSFPSLSLLSSPEENSCKQSIIQHSNEKQFLVWTT